MKCKRCGQAMIIDEWNGWRWTCPRCDFAGHEATDEEIRGQIEEMNEVWKRINERSALTV